MIFYLNHPIAFLEKKPCLCRRDSLSRLMKVLNNKELVVQPTNICRQKSNNLNALSMRLATRTVALLYSLVTVKTINLNSGWIIFLISIRWSLGSTKPLQKFSLRLATDRPPGLVLNRDKWPPLLDKLVKKYMSSSLTSSRWPTSKKHWSRVSYLFTSHIRKSTWALIWSRIYTDYLALMVSNFDERIFQNLHRRFFLSKSLYFFTLNSNSKNAIRKVLFISFFE